MRHEVFHSDGRLLSVIEEPDGEAVVAAKQSVEPLTEAALATVLLVRIASLETEVAVQAKALATLTTEWDALAAQVAAAAL